MRGTENLRYGAVLQSFPRVAIPVLSLLVPLSSIHGVVPWQQGGNKTTRLTRHGTGEGKARFGGRNRQVE